VLNRENAMKAGRGGEENIITENIACYLLVVVDVPLKYNFVISLRK
jgi:hypothetical protein